MRKTLGRSLVFCLGLSLTSASDEAPESALQESLDVYLGQLKHGA